jgi:ribonuclease VapC
MIIDTSALIAILRDEPEAKDCARAIERNPIRRLSAANFVESALVIDGSRDPIASRRFDDLVRESVHCHWTSHRSSSANCTRGLSRFR